MLIFGCCFFFSSRRRHTRCGRDWSSDVCSSDLAISGNELTAGFGSLLGANDATGWRPSAECRSSLVSETTGQKPSRPRTVSQTKGLRGFGGGLESDALCVAGGGE